MIFVGSKTKGKNSTEPQDKPKNKGGRPKKTRKIDYVAGTAAADTTPEAIEQQVLTMLLTTLADYDRLRIIHRANIARYEKLALCGELSEGEYREFESQKSRHLRVTASQ